MRGESLSGSTPRRAGIRDVASSAGVAISTVSKVLSGRGEVSAPLRERVLAAAHELGYQPNYLAQSLRRGATHLIGFVTADLRDPFSAELAAAAEGVLRPSGYTLLVISSEGDPAGDAENIRHLHNRRVDAILISPTREDDPMTVAALGEFDGPVVVIEGELRGGLPVDTVCSDHRVGAFEATRHLLALGHRRIAALVGPRERRSGRARHEGFDDAMSEAAAADGAIVVPTEHDVAEAEAATLRLLDDVRPPTALLAGSAPLLVGALQAFQRRDAAVGEDVSVVAWDDGPLTRLYRPPIAVVDRDTRGLGVLAGRIALARLSEKDGTDAAPRFEVRPTRFVPRASCAPPKRAQRAVVVGAG